MAAKENFDSIFEDTKKGKKKAAPKKAAVKKSPVKKAAGKAAPKVADKGVKAASKAGIVQQPLEVDHFNALTTVLHNHEAEALYRKGKEDKVLVWSLGILAVLVFGVMVVLTAGVATTWFGRWIIRLFFAGAAALAGVSAGSLIELNRKRLQDVLDMIVKILESFGFFMEGEYPTGNGAYFPNTYKFIGSINDDETNYAQLIIKIATVGAVVAILLLS